VFVGPDNGLLVPAIHRLGGLDRAVALTEPRYWRTTTPSPTFHGRDIFGPVAGHLANGTPLEEFGPAVTALERPFELRLADGLSGEVVHVDTYGNLMTNIPAVRLPRRYVVQIGVHAVESAPTYAAAEAGALLALVGSAGLLEISVRDGSAALHTGARRGTRVEVRAAR
jgi:S-adenosylmethionine hydrolase